MTKAELLQEPESLSDPLRDGNFSERQIDRATDRLEALKRELAPQRAPDQSRILELRGLGKEFWRSIDVEKYLREERNSWD
jgi:hypothetical protein